MESKELRATIMMAAAAALGVTLAACGGQKAAKAPSVVGATEVTASSVTKGQAAKASSATESGCGGGPDHGCGGKKPDEKAK